MKWLIILLLVSSCASTETLLKTKSKKEVATIEERRFIRKQLPRKKEYKVYVAAFFVGYCLIINMKGE